MGVGRGCRALIGDTKMNKVMALSLGLAALGIAGLAAPSFADTTAAAAPVAGVTDTVAKAVETPVAKVTKDVKPAKPEAAVKAEAAAKAVPEAIPGAVPTTKATDAVEAVAPAAKTPTVQ